MGRSCFQVQEFWILLLQLMIDGVQAPRVVCFQVIQWIMILVLLEFLVKIMSKTVTFNEICDLNLVKKASKRQ